VEGKEESTVAAPWEKRAACLLILPVANL
jgi:hypothetical protein